MARSTSVLTSFLEGSGAGAPAVTARYLRPRERLKFRICSRLRAQCLAGSARYIRVESVRPRAMAFHARNHDLIWSFARTRKSMAIQDCARSVDRFGWR